jgi:hypothetical protein
VPNHTIAGTDERERKAATAGIRFELDSQQRFGGPELALTEIEIMDEAIRLVNQSRSRKVTPAVVPSAT